MKWLESRVREKGKGLEKCKVGNGDGGIERFGDNAFAVVIAVYQERCVQRGLLAESLGNANVGIL